MSDSRTHTEQVCEPDEKVAALVATMQRHGLRIAEQSDGDGPGDLWTAAHEINTAVEAQLETLRQERDKALVSQARVQETADRLFANNSAAEARVKALDAVVEAARVLLLGPMRLVMDAYADESDAGTVRAREQHRALAAALVALDGQKEHQ